MHKIKALALVAFIVLSLIGAVMFLSRDVSRLPENSIESEHTRLHDVLRDKLFNAEEGIRVQAMDLAGDPKLARGLESVQKQLAVNTAEELRKLNSRWNDEVFRLIIDWKQSRDGAIKQSEASLGSVQKDESGSISGQMVAANWWKKSPDLVLAFVSVPLKDKQTSSILVANGIKGKELGQTNGKRFDEDAELLSDVSASGKPQMGLFSWEGHVYVAVAAPVWLEGVQVGTVVTGMELSKGMLDAVRRSLPAYVDLALVYFRPKYGDVSEGNDKMWRLFSTLDSDVQSILENEKFQVDVQKSEGALALSYDQVKPNLVYRSAENGQGAIAFSRIRWVWNSQMKDGEKFSSEEADIYLVTNLKNANEGRDSMRVSVVISGLIIMVIGMVLMLLIFHGGQSQMRRVRKAIADAITTGEPVDAEVIALLTDEHSGALPSYVIREVEDSHEERDASWSSLMVEMDELNEESSKLDAETLQRLKDSEDALEARPLYEEYMRKRRENGNNTPMEFDVFLNRLQRNAAKIKEKHHCEKVSFHVQVNDGNVVLKPRIER